MVTHPDSSLDCSKLGQVREEGEGSLVLPSKNKADNLTLSDMWVYYLITAALAGGQKCAWKLRNPQHLAQCLAQNR